MYENFKVIYPAEFYLTQKEIRQKLADAIANGEVISDVDPYTVRLLTAVELLEDTGKITFA